MKGIVAIILAGGLGTRLRPLTYKLPKPLVPVSGSPFLSHLLYKLSSMGIERAVILTGYKGGMIRKFCGRGKKWGMKLSYSHERAPLGTGGALMNARKKINATAIVLNGDSYLDIPLGKFLAFHKKKRALATVFAMQGSLEGRGAIIASRDGRVSQFLEKQKSGNGIFNTGVYLIEPAAISYLAKSLPNKFSMEKDGFPLLIDKKGFYAYTGKGKFLDIGTFSALSKAGKIVSGSRTKPQAAVFLDRDGVINRHSRDYIKHPREFEFEYMALEGMRRLSRLGMPLFIVTNQSMVNRGVVSRKALDRIHSKMLSEFRRHRVHISDILICPHRPEENCECRKPKTGMLLEAAARFNINLSRSFVIGDSTGDIAMGRSAGCKTILVRTGFGGRDKKHDAIPHRTCENLAAASLIVKKMSRKKK